MSTIFIERPGPTWALLLSVALVTGLASAKAGEIIQYGVPTAKALPFGIAAGADGNIWFAEYDGNKIGKMTSGGVLLNEFPIPTPKSFPITITTGPDGNLWFTEYDGANIGKITAAGAITEYPTPNGYPYGITTGSDGNLWFTEFSGFRIGKMTPAGVLLSEFTLPFGSEADGITNGPDGNLWFADSERHAIGRITTSGAITEYPTPTPNSSPTFITSGPDGNLWFTEYLGNKVGKITTTGVITEYPIPTLHSDPEGITSGPDGNLWFVENTVGIVASITTGGVIAEYPFYGGPWENPGTQIVGSPNGDLWFTLGATNSIYKVTTLRSPVVTMTFNPPYLALFGTSNNYGPSEMTITLSNPNSTALTGVAFTDMFPAGIYGTYTSSTCGGTVTPSTSSFTFTKLSGGSIPPNGSCWVSADIFANATGNIVNRTGAVMSDNAGTIAGASAVLTVRQLPQPPAPHCSLSGGCN